MTLLLDLPSELVVVAARDDGLVDVRQVAPELADWHARLQGEVELVAVRVPPPDDPWPLSLVVSFAPLSAGPQEVVLQGLRRWAAARGYVGVLELPAGMAVATSRAAPGAALVEVLLPLEEVLLVLTLCSPEPERLPECASLAAAVAGRVRAA